MTEQYRQNEINNTAAPRAIVSTLAVPTGAIGSEDKVVLINTTASVFTATLPAAAAAPGRTITVINNAAAPLGLTIAVVAGNALLGVAANPIGAAYGSVTLTSDGILSWIATAATP